MIVLNITMALLYNLNRNLVNLSQAPGVKTHEEFMMTLKDLFKVYFNQDSDSANEMKIL